MLPLQFFGQNLHFVISLFAALVFFAVFWLYLDAWTNKKDRKELFKWVGALLVSLSFLVYATIIEQSVLGKSFLGNTAEATSIILRLLGFIGLIIGQVLDPLQPVPEVEGLFGPEEADAAEPDANKPAKTASAPAIVVTKAFGAVFLLPVAALAIGLLYMRRATKGLERHLRPVAISFFILAGFELVSLAHLLRDSSNPNIANLVKAFGGVWAVEQILLLAGVLVLGKWVWRYLIKRFLSQLFMIFTTLTLIIFMLTTVGFTFLLMRNIQNSALDNLQTASSVLGYAIDAKKAQTRANAEAVAQNQAIAAAIVAKDHKALAALTSDFLASRKQSSLVLTTASGQVLLRAEDPERWGDSLSSDTTIRRALIGADASSISSVQGVLAPVIYIKTAVPVRDSAKNIVGTAVVSLQADNAFVDGIKRSTGLDSAIYANNVRSATTFIAPDGKSRWVGVKEQSKAVNLQVLKKGQTFKGELNILNRPFLAVYAPLKDADNQVVGMLFIGQPQTNILETAGHSIELTFVVSAVLLMLLIIPAYYTSRYLSYQLE